MSKNFKAKSSTIVKKKLGLTAIQYNCQKKLTATPYNCQKEIIGHSHPVQLSNCILEWFLQENIPKSRVRLIKFNASRLWPCYFKCFKGSWPYSTIVKKVHSHTVQLSNFYHMLSKCHGHTVQLSKKLTAIQYYCQKTHSHTVQLSKNLTAIQYNCQIIFQMFTAIQYNCQIIFQLFSIGRGHPVQ